jgi:hypothetical protein
MSLMSDDRQYAPATLRNRDFILDVLRDVLPMTGVILEIASGSGEHIVYFARNFPALVFQPSDPEPDARLSIAAWVKAARVTNVRAPVALVGLIKGAAAILPSRSPLYLYGPYKREVASQGEMWIMLMQMIPSADGIGQTDREASKGSKRRRAIKPSTRTCAIATRTGVCEISKWSSRWRNPSDFQLRLSPKCPQTI